MNSNPYKSVFITETEEFALQGRIENILALNTEPNRKKANYKIAHIVNPVKVTPDNPSYLYYAQPVTFQSMKNAKDFAKDYVEVELYTTQYPEDHDILPKNDFTILPDLDKSIHDYVEFENKSRKLPRINDIINRLYEHSKADYFIYTNADIGVTKNFYLYVKSMIDDGYDSLCIHRRDLPKEIPNVGRLTDDKMDYIYGVKGKSHPGHDCFLFKRNVVPHMCTGHVIIGYPPIGRIIRNEIHRNSKKFAEVDSSANLTFHLGEDRSWVTPSQRNSEYRRKNFEFAREAKNMIKKKN